MAESWLVCASVITGGHASIDVITGAWLEGALLRARR